MEESAEINGDGESVSEWLVGGDRENRSFMGKDLRKDGTPGMLWQLHLFRGQLYQ
jgi:hypothetical protein